MIAATAARTVRGRLVAFLRRHGLLFFLALSIGAPASGAQPAATVAPAPQTVLVIDGERHGLSGSRDFETGLRKVFAARPGMVEFFVEHLDAGRFTSAQSRQAFARFLQARYAGRKIDLVLTFTEAAADFVLVNRSRLFPRAPAVLAAVDRKWAGARMLPAGIIAMPIDYDFRGTLELALALQPDLREVVLVHGTSDYDRARLDEARAALEQFAPRLRYRMLGQLSLAAIEDEVKRLPPISMVLQTSLVKSAEGMPIDGREFAGRLAAISAVPVYAVYESYLNRGALGGSMFDYTTLGRTTGAIVWKMLTGDASSIRAANPDVSNVLVNWRALEKWRIPGSRIPPDAQIRLRPASPWEQYRHQIVIVGVLLLVLATLVALLLYELRQRWRIAAELEREHALLRQVVDINPNLIFAKDGTGRFTLANAAMADVFGTTAENIVGKTDGDFNPNREEVEFFQNTDREVLATQQENFIMEEKLTDARGNVRWLQTVKRPIFDANGRAVQVLGAATDITRRKAAEAELLRNRAELGHATRLLVMGELAASLAHELNQPLTAILSNAQAARRFMAAETIDLGDVREILDDVVSEGNRASEVIRSMRALVRRSEIEMAPLDIAELVHAVTGLLHSDAIVRDVRLVLEIAPALPAVRGDRVQLQQVVLNLLLNAFDAMMECPPGQRVATVHVTLDGPAALRVAVSDTGSGLSGDMLERIFMPFYTTKREGLGLGLSICRNIIEVHGGRLQAENNAERGATFYFTLPADNAQPVPST